MASKITLVEIQNHPRTAWVENLHWRYWRNYSHKIKGKSFRIMSLRIFRFGNHARNKFWNQRKFWGRSFCEIILILICWNQIVYFIVSKMSITCSKFFNRVIVSNTVFEIRLTAVRLRLWHISDFRIFRKFPLGA